MNMLRSISGWLSKSENRKSLAALTFIFIGLAAMVGVAWQAKLDFGEQPRGAEKRLEDAVRRTAEAEQKWKEEARAEAMAERAEAMVGDRMEEIEAAPTSREEAEARAKARAEAEAGRETPFDLILHRMQWGNIAFNAPTSMNLDETAHIQLLLGITQTIEELKQDINVEIEKKHLSGDIEADRIKVSPLIMQAHLEGYAYDIKSITPDEQPISSEITTEWQWEVRPKVAGRDILYLTLNAKLPIEGSSTYRTISTFKKEIEVEVTILQQTKNFIKDNWQWLWTAFFVPVGAWLWSKRNS